MEPGKRKGSLVSHSRMSNNIATVTRTQSSINRSRDTKHGVNNNGDNTQSRNKMFIFDLRDASRSV